jgi:SAM-dependent methyltransferase
VSAHFSNTAVTAESFRDARKQQRNPLADLTNRAAEWRDRLIPGEFGRLYREVSPYSMMSHARLKGIYDGICNVLQRGVPGDFVECGTARGGCAALMGLTSQARQAARNIWVFDTFEGLPPPSPDDPEYEYAKSKVGTCRGDLEEVQGLLRRLGLLERTRLVKGLFQDTVPMTDVGQIALLHLDGDWYESTRVCLEHLYDKVAPGGIIQIDDYGHWAGARKALHEFFEARKIHVELSYLDYTGRQFVKPHDARATTMPAPAAPAAERHPAACDCGHPQGVPAPRQVPTEYVAFDTRQRRTEFVLQRYGQYLTASVLDVGCYEAPLRQMLKDVEYVGVDIAGKPDHFIDLEAIHRLPFDDNQFHCVLCVEVLEHLDSLHRLFDELVRVSSRYLIVSLPNCWCAARRQIEKGSGKISHYGLTATRPVDRHKWFISMTQAREFFGAKATENLRLVDLCMAEKPRPALLRGLRHLLYPGENYSNRYAHTLFAVYEKTPHKGA